MIVTDIKNKRGIVLGFNTYNRFYCAMGELPVLQNIKVEDLKINNPELPSDWMVTSYCYKNSRDIPDWLDSNEVNTIFCHPQTLSPDDLIVSSYLWNEYKETGKMEMREYLIMYAMNDIRRFHGMPTIEFEKIEEFERLLMTEPELRLHDELNSYLEYADK